MKELSLQEVVYVHGAAVCNTCTDCTPSGLISYTCSAPCTVYNMSDLPNGCNSQSLSVCATMTDCTLAAWQGGAIAGVALSAFIGTACWRFVIRSQYEQYKAGTTDSRIK
jgi:hypothetical protein